MSKLIDFVLKVRVEVEPTPPSDIPDSDDEALFDGEEYLRQILDQPRAGSVEVRSFEFVLASVKED